MTDNELLLSISDMMDQKLTPIEKRMDAFDQKLDKVEQRLNAKIDYVEQSLRGDIHMINLKLENIIEPRLNEIESCYISTSKRYQQANEKFEGFETDMSVMKSILQEHGEKLAQFSA